jgi:class 3 adenylate cyclase
MPAKHPEIDLLQAGHNAVRRHAWREAYELLSAADADELLSAEDFETLAEAAWWSGFLLRCIDAREKAYRIYMDTGRHQRAGYIAITLARDYFSRRETSVANAWMSRAERLLKEGPDSTEKAWLLRTRAVLAIEGEQDFEKGLEYASIAWEMASRIKDLDVMALSLHDQGRAMMAVGKVKDGIRLMDEATVAGVGGELSPWVTGAIYCNTITACQRLGDIRRAGEWTEAAKRWCEREAIAGFPGMCRVYRAEVMRLRGAWKEAEVEARRASEELKEFNISYCAEAFYEIGEIRLHAGDLSGAEQAFGQAHELGRSPQPGLAVLRMAQGKPEAAFKSITNAVAAETRDRLSRARLLPALVEIAVEVNHEIQATEGVKELEAIARDFGTPTLNAIALSCRAILQLKQGEYQNALRVLHESLSIWSDLNAPFEIARIRLRLAEAYRGLGDMDNAILELKAGKGVFERLGAKGELARVDKLRHELEKKNQMAPGERIGRTFVFTDIVKSTALVEAIGDDAWADLVRWHDQKLRELFSRFGGDEVDHAGDGFFIAFPDASMALDCAVGIQNALSGHRRDHGFAPQVRIGVHTSEAIQEGGKYKGRGVHEASRIAALAEGGEIVVSEQAVLQARRLAETIQSREVILKGIREPIRVYTLKWR